MNKQESSALNITRFVMSIGQSVEPYYPVLAILTLQYNYIRF